MKFTTGVLFAMFMLNTYAEETVVANGLCKDGKDEFCLACAGEACIGCASSYLDATTKQCMAPTTALDDCLSYESATKCSGCKDKYYLNSSAACVEITEANCFMTDTAGKCTHCDNGIVGTDGKCPGTTACTVANCSVCQIVDAKETCVKCADTYLAMADGTCSTGASNSNCAMLTTAGKCGICMPGYYDSSKKAAATDNSICTASTRQSAAVFVNFMIAAVAALFF